jgi:hypothetical protein
MTSNKFVKVWSDWSISYRRRLDLTSHSNFPAERNPTAVLRKADASKLGLSLPTEEETAPRFGWMSGPEGGRGRRARVLHFSRGGGLEGSAIV